MAEDKVEHAAGVDVKIRAAVQRGLHVLLVQLPVHLSPWTLLEVSESDFVGSKCSAHPDCSALGPVQDLELNASFICSQDV